MPGKGLQYAKKYQYFETMLIWKFAVSAEWEYYPSLVGCSMW